MVDAHSATAADFDGAARRHASTFWFWLVVTGLCWWLAPSSRWALAPAVIALFYASNSIGATRAARDLRNGRYRVANPNNGAPDGDTANWGSDGQQARVGRQRTIVPAIGTQVGSTTADMADDDLELLIQTDAMDMCVAALRSLADRTAALAQRTATQPAESEVEEAFRQGMAEAQRMLAKELNSLADKAA